jgi:hypothetical protein
MFVSLKFDRCSVNVVLVYMTGIPNRVNYSDFHLNDVSCSGINNKVSFSCSRVVSKVPNRKQYIYKL